MMIVLMWGEVKVCKMFWPKKVEKKVFQKSDIFKGPKGWVNRA